MNKVIWKCPVPSTGFLRGPDLVSLGARKLKLFFEYEGSDGEAKQDALLFFDVYSYRVTFLPALSADVIKSAYDKVVEIENSEELRQVAAIAMGNNRPFSALKHFRVGFDDGPCFDFIANDFQVNKGIGS
jgi:hypothetical protein